MKAVSKGVKGRREVLNHTDNRCIDEAETEGVHSMRTLITEVQCANNSVYDHRHSWVILYMQTICTHAHSSQVQSGYPASLCASKPNTGRGPSSCREASK